MEETKEQRQSDPVGCDRLVEQQEGQINQRPGQVDTSHPPQPGRKARLHLAFEKVARGQQEEGHDDPRQAIVEKEVRPVSDRLERGAMGKHNAQGQHQPCQVDAAIAGPGRSGRIRMRP